MKRSLLAIAMTAIIATPSAFATTLESENQKLSYSFGLMVANQMKGNFADLDVKIFAAAVADIYAGKESQLDKKEVEAVLQKFQEKQLAAQKLAAKKAAVEAQAAAEKIAKVNIEEGKKFLAENGKRKGVITTKSGLQVEITTRGTGAKPTLADTVVVHYAGTTIDGVEFDSSIKRKTPATFPLGGVIAGWKEGIQLLPVGSKAKLYIPSSIGYGLQGAGGEIGPGATLIFEVELIEIVKKEAPVEEKAPKSK
ncbi:MAG: hypothetical protein OFPII_40030 [Osedax symbiont Rs1]|nr:MAG: hypothetical protein OFPII_40030 [Osedax symbiont Rs1]